MKFTIFVFVVCSLLTGTFSTFAQATPNAPRDPRNPLPEFVNRNAEKRREFERDLRRGESDLENEGFNPDELREDIRKKQISEEESKRIELLIAPNPVDVAKFQSFLKSDNTGLTRLIPDFGCKSETIIYIEGKCVGAVTNGWVYSFRQDSYAEGSRWGDLRLEDSNLIADGFLMQGIFVSLGDISLDELVKESDGISFLTDFKPATKHSEVKTQSGEFAKGIEHGGYVYSKQVKFDLNSTYAIRSVAYKSNKKTKSEIVNKKIVWNGDPLFNSLNADKRMDIIVVFRVVRIEENGGITILWKEISRQKAPEILFAKNEKLTDIR